jgi:hypothetical protein
MLFTSEKELLKLVPCGHLEEYDIDELKKEGEKNGAKNLFNRLRAERESRKGQKANNSGYKAK